MKRTVNLAIAVGFALAILVGIWVSLAPAHARTIDVDAQDDWSGPDWAMSPLIRPNLAHIGRDPQWEGEYIWSDNLNDERTDLANPDTNADLIQFRVTGDEENLYFAAQMQDITLTDTAGAPQIQIAIDTNRQSGVGEMWLAGLSETRVHTDAQWEYLLQTQFAYTSTPAARLYTAGNWSGTFVGHTAISADSNIIEMSVPWSSLGFSEPPTQPLRMTVAVCREDANGNCMDINNASDILDAITNYGDPGATSNTWAEVEDGIMNYYFDLFFQPDGDVYAPVVLSEVLYDPSGTESAAEFIELYNAAPISLPLAMYKVGDEETPDSTEGMETLPGGWIAPGEVVVIANNAQTFSDTYDFLPDYAFSAAGLPVSATTNYAAWASGSVQLSNGGDEVLLLDPFDTVIDVVIYEGESWPGMTGNPAALNGHSLERCPADIDTNDMDSDFVVQGNDGTPAQVCYVDFSMQKSVSPSTVRSGDEVTYTIVLSNAGNALLRDGYLQDPLPGDVAFVRWINASGATLSGNLITWSGDIPANTDIPISFVVRNQANGKTVTNTAVFTYAEESYQAQATYVAEVSPELAFTKDASPANVAYHGLITYTLQVSNDGEGDASDVMLTDTLPAEVDFFDWLVQPSNATVNNDVVTWSGMVTAQQSISLSFRVRHVASTWGMLTNEATCTGDGQSLSASAQVIIAEPMPELHISKSVTPTAVGYMEPLTYTVILSNTGDRDANGVRMTDTLPSEVSFSRWVQQPPGATYANGVITWTGVVSTAPQTFVFVVTNTSRSPRATVSNLARYTHESGSGSATADYTVLAPSVTLLKEVSPVAMQRMGEIITCTITFSNDGNASATSAILTDTLPGALTFGGWVLQPGGAVEVSGTITWTGELAPTDTIGLIFTATLDGPHFDEIITNTAFFVAEDLPLLQNAASFTTPHAHTIYLPLVMRNH